MNKVLVAPWGNPFQWKPATYEINGELIKSRSTLPALIRELKPNSVFVVVLDTLVNMYVCNNFDKETRKCLEKWPDQNDVPTKNVSTYTEVASDIRSRVEWFLWKLVEETKEEEYSQELEKMINNKQIKIIIAPGIGTHSNPPLNNVTVSISGDCTVLDYYYYIVYELSKLLPAGDLTVYLDLTHGINFMPVLTYRAVSNLLSLGSYAWNVKFKVFNAEPYSQGVNLKIHKVEDATVKPKPQYFVVSGHSDWNAFISSIVNGFPLVFATFFPDSLKVKQHADYIYEEFCKTIKVSSELNDNSIKVEIRRNMLPEDLHSTALLYYLIRVMNAKFGEIYPKDKEEFTLYELENISKLFDSIPAIGWRVKKDIENIKKLKYIHSNWDNLGKLRRGKNWKKFEKICGPGETQKTNQCIEVRNFIAHSGFDDNIVQLRKINSNIYIRYDPNLRDVVLELAVKSLEGDSVGE